MSGASRWLDAFPASGPKPCAVAMVAIAAVLEEQADGQLAHVMFPPSGGRRGCEWPP